MTFLAQLEKRSLVMAPEPIAPLATIDSPLFGASFVDAQMRKVFDAGSFVQRCVEVEVALARAEARLGVIPDAAADGIAAVAQAFRFDWERLRRETEIVGYPILPIVEQLADAAGEAGRYLHWGATTQDIMDTATVLQMRAAIAIVEVRLAETIEALRRLAKLHRDTPMAGARTSSTRCPSPSATRRRSGFRRSSAIASASPR